MVFDSSAVIIREPGNVAAEIDDELVILSMAANAYISLDPVGRAIWELTESPITVAELVHQLGERYEGSDGEIEADLQVFLAKIHEAKLIHLG